MPIPQQFPTMRAGLLAALLFLMAGCGYTPPPMSKTPVRLPVPLADLFLRPEDLPDQVSYTWDGGAIDDPYLFGHWDWSGAIDAQRLFYESTLHQAREIHQLIVRYPEAIGATSVWPRIDNTAVMRDMEVYDLLPPIVLADAPPLHADQVNIKCETYWPEGEPFWCAARLQYKMLYTEVIAPVSANPSSATLSPAEFYTLTQAADARMRPIWEEWPVATLAPMASATQPTAPAPLATPAPALVTPLDLLPDPTEIPPLVPQSRPWLGERRVISGTSNYRYENRFASLGAVEQLRGEYRDRPTDGDSLTITILRMLDAQDAARAWAERKNDTAEPRWQEFWRRELTVFSLAALPPLHADQIYIRCDDYFRGIDHRACVARLQYGMFYVEMSTQPVGGLGSWTQSKFYYILSLIDERMRPIWEHSP